MYIPEFWCGVVATVLLEVLLSVVLSILDGRKRDGENETGEEVD